RRERPERRERPPREKKEQKKERPAPRPESVREEPAPSQPVSLGEEVDDEKAAAIKAFLGGLLEHMDSAAEVKVYLPENGRYKVILEGQGLGALIGRRGETLDAIQQITSYAVNRGGGPRVRIHLDAENYRAKREQSLQHLARKVAGKVVRYRRSVTLEPMNAYERHVIHTALQDFEGVTTYSTGTDPNRRVVVAFDRGERH
uniref:RNA-binding cell elongation regulator Jag/EloR n=1 Tax=Oscillibacter sp. TaxID=1945593 RepID=UPI002D7FBFCA